MLMLPRSFALLFLASYLAAGFVHGEELILELQAAEFDRKAVPVAWQLPAAARNWKDFSLRSLEDDGPIPTQRDQQGDKSLLVWMLEKPLPAGTTRKYGLREAARANDTTSRAAVIVEETDRTLEVSVRGKPVLVYNHAVVPSEDPKEPAYRRSGFIHPLYDPAGHVVSDGMPPDHMHQHGIMFAWVETTFAGRSVDFWNSGKHEGEVRHARILSQSSGPVFGRIRVSLEHVDLTTGAQKGVVAIIETWEVTVYDRTEGFLFDIRSGQQCASDSPLVIKKYHYGGMAFRGARHWHGAEGCRFLTSEGHDRKAGNHTRAWWCDISGPAEEEGSSLAGLTVFCSLDNFRAPQHVRLHPTMPYWVWSPMVEEPFTIEPGKPYQSGYRYLVHTGDADATLADQISRAYRDPPIVNKR